MAAMRFDLRLAGDIGWIGQGEWLYYDVSNRRDVACSGSLPPEAGLKIL